ncbi:MAG: CBS domain-containing protein [Bdellovibrionaceae bacterium]|nr:CBS domain-containing protein [Pseudobdellovibrionaceae bacterium]
MKRHVKDLINQRGLKDFATVRPDDSISDALNVLLATNCSAVLVVKNNRLKGIFSEKDFAKSSLRNGSILSDNVESIMTTKVYYVEPTFTLEECLQIMSKVHIRHLPVMDNDTPIAMLSMRHIMEALVDDKENRIRELTTYITGSNDVLEFNQEKENFSKILTYSSQQSQEVS